jgi:hypothetical protein
MAKYTKQSHSSIIGGKVLKKYLKSGNMWK